MLGGGGVPVKSIQPRPLALFAICHTQSYLGVASTAAKMAGSSCHSPTITSLLLLYIDSSTLVRDSPLRIYRSL